MPKRRVFFSFDYEDVKNFRVEVVRQHGRIKSRDNAGFFDASIFEEAQAQGSLAVKRLINRGLRKTSVTCVLIGTGTWARRWVRYEIIKSIARTNIVIGVHINRLRGKEGRRRPIGRNPFDYLAYAVGPDGYATRFYEKVGDEWQDFADLSRATDLQDSQSKWGEFAVLVDEIAIYDWVLDDGYNNFTEWVDFEY